MSLACAGAAGNALRAADSGHTEDALLRPRRVAAEDRHARLAEAGVELEHVVDIGVARRRERDDQPLRLRTRSGEVAEMDRRGPPAEAPPRDPAEAEVHTFDERVLRHDDAAG